MLVFISRCSTVGLRSVCTPRISIGPAGYHINRDYARRGGGGRLQCANIYNAYTRADKWPAGDAAGKVRGGEGRGSAPGMVQCRGARRWGTVVGVCLVPRIGTGDGLW